MFFKTMFLKSICLRICFFVSVLMSFSKFDPIWSNSVESDPTYQKKANLQHFWLGCQTTKLFLGLREQSSQSKIMLRQIELIFDHKTILKWEKLSFLMSHLHLFGCPNSRDIKRVTIQYSPIPCLLISYILGKWYVDIRKWVN
jgi:hypothetical protein